MPDSARRWRKNLGDKLSPGDVIDGKYRLDRIIGSGGMGVVVEAHHVELEARVAVKLLRPSHYDTETARRRFRREARAAFQITSEHVARILDLGGYQGGGLYMAMEYLDGRDLSQVLVEHGKLPVGTAVGYILQVCEAVAEAHSLGIVHRDLKPENIFLCAHADGSPCTKVIDFGLAKVEDRVQSLTGMNRGLGTPRYMSPEQWVSARDVGGATDIWALGVILFELVTGKSPFDDGDVDTLCQAVIAGPVPSASAVCPTLPLGLDDVIATCLQKNPEHRYASAGELAAALMPFAQLAGEPTDESSARPPAPAPMWRLSNTDVREVHETRPSVAAEPIRDEATTVENLEVGRAHEKVRPPAPRTRADSSGEWAVRPLEANKSRKRSPALMRVAIVASVGLLAVLGLSIASDSEDASTTAEASAEAATESPDLTTRRLAPLAPVAAPRAAVADPAQPEAASAAQLPANEPAAEGTSSPGPSDPPPGELFEESDEPSPPPASPGPRPRPRARPRPRPRPQTSKWVPPDSL